MIAAPAYIRPLTVNVRAGRVARACTRPIAASVTAAVWVYSNGRELHSATSTGRVMYYAGAGTLVRLISHPGDGPVCLQAMTWTPRARVRVRFRVL